MINDKQRELLSALLDDQLPPEEKRMLEEQLKTDPTLRAEWDSMREFAGLIAMTAPAPVQVPADFRVQILQRLKATPGSTPDSLGDSGSNLNRPAGSSPFSKINLPTYLITGTVLVGLVGTMMYVDHHRPKEVTVASAGVDALGVSQPVVNQVGSGEGLGAEVIQGQGDQARSDANARLKGAVLTMGEGRAEQAGSIVAQPWNPGKPKASTEVTLEVSSTPINLESQGGWTLERVAEAGRQRQWTVPASVIWELSRRHHLNPGLLGAALKTVPTRTVQELALDLRASLDSSVSLSGDLRLRKCLRDLGVNETQLEEWRKQL